MGGNPSRRPIRCGRICVIPTCNACVRVVVVSNQESIHVRKCDPSSCPSTIPIELKHGLGFVRDAGSLKKKLRFPGEVAMSRSRSCAPCLKIRPIHTEDITAPFRCVSVPANSNPATMSRGEDSCFSRRTFLAYCSYAYQLCHCAEIHLRTRLFRKRTPPPVRPFV